MGRKHGDGRGRLGGKPKGYKAPSTMAKEQARELAVQIIMRDLEALLQAHIANALGISYLVTREKNTGKFIRVGPAMASRTNEETIEVWEKDQNVQAIIDLLNRAIDKPTEHLQADLAVDDWEKRAADLASARGRVKE